MDDRILTKNDCYEIMYYADRVVSTYRYEGYFYDNTLEHPYAPGQDKEYIHATFDEFFMKMRTSFLNFPRLYKLCNFSLLDLSEMDLEEVKELINEELPFLREDYRSHLADDNIMLSGDFTDDYLDEVLAAEWRNLALIHMVQLDIRTARKKGHVPGYPIYEVTDKVVFQHEDGLKTGVVKTVDSHGTADQKDEPCYDIWVTESPEETGGVQKPSRLYKHIRESEITVWLES